MLSELNIPLATVYAFLLVLFRIGGVFVFIPIPGVRNAPAPARIVLALGLTVALYSKWPAPAVAGVSLVELMAWSLSELALGVTVGLLVSFVTEMFALGAQAVSLPAGYTYASSVDPATQAESNVLVILAQLISGLLFFAFGFHRQLLFILVQSLETHPPGTFELSASIAEEVLQVGSTVFTLGLGLVIPILALLAMIDISLALLGRLNTQLQVIFLSFPIKLLASLVFFAALGSVMPRLFNKTARHVISIAQALLS